MKVQIELKKKFEVDLEINDVIEQINEFPVKEKLNCSARILNGIQIGDVSILESEQREIIVKYLENKLKLFKNL